MVAAPAVPDSPSGSVSLSDFRTLRDAFPPPQVIDVRREPAFAANRVLIPGSVRCAPDAVERLAASLEPWRPVVTVCVHGHEVSQNAAATLVKLGYSARSLDEGLPQGNAQGGPRQISATGPYYRGVAAPPNGPTHHYVFEIYALDAPIDVPAVGQSPPLTRAAVEAAMVGKIRARGTLVGLFKR